MDEEEWLACTDPARMLQYLWDAPGDRKLRLFAIACCRQVWERLTLPPSRAAVEIAERYSDGQGTADEVEQARQEHRVRGAHRTQKNAADAVSNAALVISRSGVVSLEAAFGAAQYAAKAATDKAEGGDRSPKDPVWLPLWNVARTNQVKLLRDVIGNPFRPSPPLPHAVLAWNDGTVRRLAEAIYEERRMPEGTLDTARLAILADALLDAGCDDEALIQHCRSAGPHVRGCWALDLILEKS